MKKLISLFILFFCLNLDSQAQYLIRDHLAIGVGPTMIYGENAGIYSSFRFKVRPAISLSYNHEISDSWDIRATLGNQWIESGGFDPPNREWAENHQAIDFSGMVLYGDLMPVFQINPNYPGRVGNVLNYYAGAGVGYLYAMRTDRFLIPRQINNGPLGESNLFEEERNTGAVYVPIRIGVSTNLESNWDLAFEGTAMIATNSRVDGNTMKNKILGPDALFQLQIKVKRYLGRW